MNPLSYIDLYCERNGPEFWNEPLNAISNLAFIVVAASLWLYAVKRDSGDRWQQLVIVVAGTIGIGSFLFHTFATGWAELADIVPIWCFVACYTLLIIYRLTQHNTVKTLILASIAMGTVIAIASFTTSDLSTESARAVPPFNGSLQYAPAVLVLLVFTVVCQIQQHPVRHHLLTATALFSIALAFRTIDQISCVWTQGIGTHFLWHLLDALTIGVLLHALITRLPPPERTSSREAKS